MGSAKKSETIMFRTNAENKAIIRCPSCGAERPIEPLKIKGIDKGLKIRCKCGHQFKCKIEFRKQFRKRVRLLGEYLHVSTDRKGEMMVMDVSQNGLAFENMTPHPMNEGDMLVLRFKLDDPRESLINKRGQVRSIKNNQIGVQFEETQWFDKELGFYLRS